MEMRKVTPSHTVAATFQMLLVSAVWAALSGIAGINFWSDGTLLCVAAATYAASMAQFAIVDKNPSILGPNFFTGVGVWFLVFVLLKVVFLVLN